MSEQEQDIDKLLAGMGMGQPEPEPEPAKPACPEDNPWDRIIRPESTYLMTGDVGAGKSALLYWLLERYSATYNLRPCVVGLPENKLDLVKLEGIIPLSEAKQLTTQENVIAVVDEAGIQLPLDDTKVRNIVTNILALPRQRNQILILCYHIPRLVLARYLSFFSAFLLKRPPFLIEFASKSKNDSLTQMMYKAEERFAELVPPSWNGKDEKGNDVRQPVEVVRSTYVVSPALRWQGMLTNPTPSFWSPELSKIWHGTVVEPVEGGKQQTRLGQKLVLAMDGKTVVSDEMQARKVKLEDIATPDGPEAVWIDPISNSQWIS